MEARSEYSGRASLVSGDTMNVILKRNLFVDGKRFRKAPHNGTTFIPDDYKQFLPKDAVVVDQPYVPTINLKGLTLRDLDLSRADADAVSELLEESNKDEDSRLAKRNAQQAKKVKEANGDTN